jgi:uncharacterized protein YlxW (UPF0749 family)
MEAESRGALCSLLEASVWEFPLVLQKWVLGLGGDSREVEEAVLKACQAWTNLADQAMERIFQAEGFIGLLGASVKHLVQCHRVARDFMESLMPDSGAVKAATNGAEVRELSEAVARLRREVRALTARVNLIDRRDGAGGGTQESAQHAANEGA